MSERELKRRQIASTVFREAWSLKRRTHQVVYSIGTALTICWKTVRGLLRYCHTKVRGTTFENRQRLLCRLAMYDPRDISITLIREPENEFDRHAVQVWASVFRKGAACIGFVSAELAATLAPLMDAGKRPVAVFDEITGGGDHLWGCNFRFLII